MEIHKDYPCHPANYLKGRTSPVSFLVVHYVGGLGSAEANAKYYGGTAGIGASAHYFVDHGPEAEIWTSVAEGDTAWHCGARKYVHPTCRNANSIGVELCCRQDDNGGWYFDPATVDAAVELCRDIMGRYGITVDRVLRHYDVTGKQCPRPWVVDQEGWDTFKGRLTAGASPRPTEPAWYEKDRTWAMETGISDGTRPTDTCTRAEVWAMLHRLGQRK